MRCLTKYWGLIAIITLLGCERSEENAALAESGEFVLLSSNGEGEIETLGRKLIKDGRAKFETDNIEGTRATIFEVVDKLKGYISSDEEYKSTGRMSHTLEIRVPASNFDRLLTEATQGVEKFDSKEINVKDVTEEFLDIEARLKTKKELEARYLDLLKQAVNVIEILEIEKQIGLLRSEIESVEGRLKYLQSQVSYSTLTLSYYELIPSEKAFRQKFKNGFQKGWDNLIGFLVVLVNIWPFILISLGLIFGIRAYRKRK